MDLTIAEYSPTEVKQAIVGQGHADKDQVAKMVQLLIGKREFETSDASDGLALAICHAHAAKTIVNQGSSEYAKALQAASGRRPRSVDVAGGLRGSSWSRRGNRCWVICADRSSTTAFRSGDGKIIVGVGSEAHGFVGYSVNVPKNPHYELLPVGQVASSSSSIPMFAKTSWIFTAFPRALEKEMFLTLLSVNGIGPKGALSILSNADASQLIQAVVDGDTELLTKIPGIGKKTAERVVLELAEPLRKKMDARP